MGGDRVEGLKVSLILQLKDMFTGHCSVEEGVLTVLQKNICF